MSNPNARVALAGGVVIALVVGAVLWFGLAPRSAEKDAANAPGVARGGAEAVAGGTVAADTNASRKPLYWHDPMVPGPKFDKPGKSPFMDMQLVPVYADAGGDTGKVTISPRTVQNLGVRIADVTEGAMDMGFAAVGAVSVDERSITAVQSRVNGYVERLYVRAQYDPVARGQPLAEIYAPEWLSAQEEYLALSRSTQPAVEPIARAARQRLVLLGISEAQIARLARDGVASPRVTLYAPSSGLVWEQGVRDGQAVSPGMTLFKLADLATVWVNAEVPETDAARVLPNVAVEVRTAAMPGRVFNGKVAALLPDVNATTRTIKARIVVANPDRSLQPGMFAKVNFRGTREQGLMVPSEAVISTGTRNVVLVAEGDGKFRPVDVEIGRESGALTEVRKGLLLGQKVVASGQFLIDSEASLKATTTRMSDMPAPDGGKAAGPTHRGAGKVESIAKDEITISHGPIPTLQWGPMTMGFKLPANGLPKNIAVGDSVVFEIRPLKDGMFEITTISPNAAAPMQGMPAKGASK